MPERRQHDDGDGKYAERYIGRSQLPLVCIADSGIAEVGERPKRHPKDQDGRDKTDVSVQAQPLPDSSVGLL